DKMIKKLNITILFIFIFFFSREDFLEEKPHSFLAPENFYQNENDALSALPGAYAGLGSGSSSFLARRVHYITWFPSDEAYPPRLGAQKQLDNFTYTADHGDINNTWTEMYDLINRANVVIDRVGLIDMNESLKQQYIAEAKFIRALAYFYGVRLWGALPLIISEVTAVSQVSGIERAPIS